MVIKQISVFVENVPGKIVEVSQILGENNIDMSALSLADSSDFGILRLIVNDPEKPTRCCGSTPSWSSRARSSPPSSTTAPAA